MNKPGARFVVDPRALQWRFMRASGPGGQNVNKVETAVELRYDTRQDGGLSETACARLRRLAGNRMTDEGVVVIQAQRFRSQARNRDDALSRLQALLQRALQPARRRIATRPTQASRERRLSAKKRLGQRKSLRGRVRDSG